MISAKVVAASINAQTGKRITSIVTTYPRIVHSDLMTHRLFSRNASSSRAIPVAKMIQAVKDNTAFPVSWGKNQSGMQAGEEVSPEVKAEAIRLWQKGAETMVELAENLSKLGLHKQVCNRPLEWCGHITVLITATDFDNFFALRYHPDADPTLQAAAQAMLDAYVDATPKYLQQGEWHIPFGDKFVDGLTKEQLLKVATARAARISYNNFDGVIDYNKDYELHDDLVKNGHFSPTEHCAEASVGRFGNFTDFKQYRQSFAKQVECRKFDYDEYKRKRDSK